MNDSKSDAAFGSGWEREHGADPDDPLDEGPVAGTARDDRLRLMRDRVEYMASPELEGRAPGTPGGILARSYVEEAFADLDLRPAGDDGYRQSIPAIGGANLLGVLPGSGPLADRYVVLAAHYDHIGVNFGKVHPGADDNASGVAVLLDVASRLSEGHHEGRSVLVASFDAEEPPHFYTENMGSVHFVANPTVPLDRIDMMLCLDLIGHALGPDMLPAEVRNSVFLMGAEKSPGVGAMVDGIDAAGMVARRLDSDIFPPLSDHYAFQLAGIPFLFLTNGRDRYYHTPEDTAEKLAYGKMLGLADYLADLIGDLAVHDRYTFEASAVDDAATLETLVAIGRQVAPLSSKHKQLLALVDKMEQRLETATPLSAGDRGTLQAALLAIEQALA